MLKFMEHLFKKIALDTGILVSLDPVALVAASFDFVEKRAGDSLSQLAYDIPFKVQLDYAKELHFGNQDYELIRF